MSNSCDTWEARWAGIKELACQVMEYDVVLPPVYILSHARLDIPTLKTLDLLAKLNLDVTVVVPEEAYLDYFLEWEKPVHVLLIPAEYRGVERGVGQARQFVLDTAEKRGQDIIVMLDDDITGIAMMYQGEDGKASSAHVERVGSDRDIYRLGVFANAVLTAVDVMREHPRVVIMGPQNRNDQRTLDAALSAYDLNYGRMPIGFVVWNTKRFREVAGAIDMRYNRHGEDLWSTMTILHNGGWYGRIPNVLVSYYDEHTQSTLKNPDTEKAVRNEEGERVATERWFDKLRIKRYPDGSYHGGAPNMKKFRASAPFRRVLWSGEVLEKPVPQSAPEPREGVTMKVNVNAQIEISDEQRVQMGALLSGAEKPKYRPTRDEIKQFAWEQGEGWADYLEEQYQREFGPLNRDQVDDLIYGESEDTAPAVEDGEHELDDLI